MSIVLSAALLACATGVAPSTMEAVVRVESGGNPLAIQINDWKGDQPRPRNAAEAAATARKFIALGYSVDLGIAQLNSKNLGHFNMTVEDAFDDCKNMAAGAAVLSGFYGQAVQRFGEGQTALASALSGYNTGNFIGGFANGYVGKYYIHATLPAPATAPAVAAAKARPVSTVKVDMVAYDRPGYAIAVQ